MAQKVTYRVVDRSDGCFDLIVLLGTRSVYARRGFKTLAEVEENVGTVRALMEACGALVVRSDVPTDKTGFN